MKITEDMIMNVDINKLLISSSTKDPEIQETHLDHPEGEYYNEHCVLVPR